MTPVVSTVCPASGGERRMRVERARGAGEEEDLGLGRGDRQDQQLLLVECDLRRRRDGAGWPCGQPGAGGGGGSIDADDLDVLEQQRQLDAQRVDARDHGDRAVGQDLDDREGIAAEADDQVERCRRRRAGCRRP